MYINFERSNDLLLVKLNGELDHNSSQEVRVKMDEKIDQFNTKNVVLDFSSVSFMDSSGIGVVVGRHKKLINNGGYLSIACVSRNVDRIFELAGMYRLINKFDTVDEAVRRI